MSIPFQSHTYVLLALKYILQTENLFSSLGQSINLHGIRSISRCNGSNIMLDIMNIGRSARMLTIEHCNYFKLPFPQDFPLPTS